MWTAECQALNQEEGPCGLRLLDAPVAGRDRSVGLPFPVAGWISARPAVG